MKTKRTTVSPFWKQLFVTTSVGINIVSHGCAIGYPAVLLPQLLVTNSPIPLSPEKASWIASILGITQLIGSFVSPPIMSRWGRKIAHLAVTLPALIGWFILPMGTSFEALMIARTLHGLSIGMLSPLRSVLIGEYSSPKYRGAFLTTVSLTQSFGIFFVHLLGSFISWQLTSLICAFFAFASLLMTIYSPESPSWLVSKGKYEECRDVFRWLRGDGEDEELEEMIKARMLFENARILQKNTRTTSAYEDMVETIKKKEFYKPIIIMTHAYLMIQFAGGTTMAAYSTTIIALVMGPNVDLNFWMIFLDAQRLIFNSVAVFVINKLKRRTMMFWTGGLCVFSQVALSAYTYVRYTGTLSYNAIWLPALLINLQFFTVATGMLPLPNVIGGELFPLEYRSTGGTICQATMSLSMFVVLKTFTFLVDNLGMHGTYLLYAICLAYFLTVIWFMLPETKGKTLQQIEDELRGRPLTYIEMQSRMSLQNCPVTAYKRKMSRNDSSPLLH